ncbi:M12 family metallo-peptidase [Dokdonella koreensis]|uniref:Peptidyl-Asp metallopeptidase n=1 Tax=Dokdonella koreensis DS-123 TaxID=1300342 RepID=A0A160DY57_9GAMM|nr:M12 family metallo-peptidase [Dokdonella koreensis]ANB19350.1 Peptidyl-Asp metallopeptidase [Dokdonella koreensis DS-123]
MHIVQRPLLISFFFACAGFTATASASEQEQAPRLFVTTEKQPPPSEPGPWLQSWHITIDQQAIQQPAETITLNVPGQREIVVRQMYWSPKAGYLSQLVGDGPEVIWLPDPSAKPDDFAWEWYGRSEGHTVSIVFNYGVIAARIWTPEHKYALQPRPGDVTELAEVNPDWWQMHPDREEQHPGQAATDTPLHGTPDGLTPSGPPTWDLGCTAPLPTTASTIDVLVMYTTDVLGQYGSHAGVETEAIRAIKDANDSLRNSGIWSVRFFLRGVEQVPPPADPFFNYGLVNIEQAMFHLAGVQGTTTNYPGWIYNGNPAVSSRRNALQADVVALARIDISGDDTCGVAFVQRLYDLIGGRIEPGPEFERKSYLVFDPRCGVDRLNLAHELGHLLGMEHDPRNAGMPGTAFTSCPWSYGHRNSSSNPNAAFRTVMSYADMGSGSGPICTGKHACPLIDAYSNPAYAWNGAIVPNPTPGALPIGVATGGSAGPAARANDTLARLAPIVAAFRTRPDLIFANGFQ